MSELRSLIESGRLLIVPGAANALTARIIEDCGFESVYVTGAGIANTHLAVPDIGLLTFSELLAHVAAIRSAVGIPLIVDADTGFGEALNVRRTVRDLELAGANAIQLEDQSSPKRCGHFDGKDVIPSINMVAKIKAAVDARNAEATLIIPRTDARAVFGIDEACERANLYGEAGADVLFVEAPRSITEIEQVATSVYGPKVINLVIGGSTPIMPQPLLQELGFTIALHANLALLAAVRGMQEALGTLKHGGMPPAETLATWEERQRLVRRAEFEDLDKLYSVSQQTDR